MKVKAPDQNIFSFADVVAGKVKSNPFTVLIPIQTKPKPSSEASTEESSTTIVDMVEVSYVLAYTPQSKNTTTSSTMPCWGCRTCRSRARKFIGHVGATGPMFLNCQNSSITFDEKELTTCQQLSQRMFDNGVDAQGKQLRFINPTLSLVTKDFYPPSKGISTNTNTNGTRFDHWTIFPSSYTEHETAIEKAGSLNSFINYATIDNRLANFMTVDGRKSFAIIVDCIKEIDHPELYRSGISWMTKILDKYRLSLEDMSLEKIYELRLFAMLSGKSDGNKHLDYMTCANFVVMLNMTCRSAVINAFNHRSDERNYQRSAVTKALAAKSVTSKYTVSLSWSVSDDLDLHVFVDDNGCGRKHNSDFSGDNINTLSDGHVFYKNKRYSTKTGNFTLDFDAGVQGNETAPVENISCPPGVRFHIFVNNYRIRSPGSVPGEIVIRQLGCPEIVHSFMWPAHRPSGNGLYIASHTFNDSITASFTSTDGLSVKAARAMLAQDDEFMKQIGNATSTVATLFSLESGVEFTAVAPSKVAPSPLQYDDLSYPPCHNQPIRGLPQMQNVSIIELARHRATKSIRPSTKTSLAASCQQHPTTISELVAWVKNTPNGSVHILPINFVPGYITNIKVADPTCIKRSSVVCCYSDKHKLPTEVVTHGNARFDDSWGINPMAPTCVSGIVKIKGTWFFALDGVSLPCIHDDAFPLGGGFYPTMLTSKAHTHRSRFSTNHSQVVPVLPQSPDSGLAIGAFLTTHSFKVLLDGHPHTIHLV